MRTGATARLFVFTATARERIPMEALRLTPPLRGFHLPRAAINVTVKALNKGRFFEPLPSRRGKSNERSE
jgi:hypothetical protein